MKKLLAIVLIGTLTLQTKAQSFLGWNSNDTAIFKVLNNGTAQYSQPSGGFKKNIVSPLMFFSPDFDSIPRISFSVTGFTNGGFNSCGLKPQMIIRLINQQGDSTFKLDSFPLDNSMVTFNTPVGKSGFYRVQIEILTKSCNNNSLPTITLSDLKIPIILLPNYFSEVRGLVLERTAILSWDILNGNETITTEVEKEVDGIWTRVSEVRSDFRVRQRQEFTEDLSSRGHFVYRLVSVNTRGDKTYSKNIHILSDFDGTSNLLVYPNPAGESPTVFLSSDKVNGKMRTLYGVEVKVFSNSNQIDVSDLPNGIYIIELSTGEKIKFQK